MWPRCALPGDTLRRIHWRTTARREELYVKEYDNELAGDLWIVLDLHSVVQAGQGDLTTEEHGVTLAASLAAAMLRQNRAVGFLSEGAVATLLPLEGGETQLWRILRSLASARALGAAAGAPVVRLAPSSGAG